MIFISQFGTRLPLRVDTVPHSGAASDKVAALQKAGVIVTDSPAKIGSEMLKVGDLT